MVGWGNHGISGLVWVRPVVVGAWHILTPPGCRFSRNLFGAQVVFCLPSSAPTPCRAGDDDLRCGPASLQKFAGEDLQALSVLKLRKEEDLATWEAQADFKATEVANKAAAEKAEQVKVTCLVHTPYSAL